MSTLDVHPASDRERRAAFENVHEFWGGGKTLEEHLAHRESSPQHNFAEWFVGCIDGQVVTSLGAYPLQIRLQGESVRAMAIGAVHTRPEFRGQGLAPQLIDQVERQQAQRGTGLSMLYSDIDPAYYARIGYQLGAAWTGWRDCRQEVPDCRALQLDPIDPTTTMLDKPILDPAAFKDQPLWIERSPTYWEFLLAKSPEDQHYSIRDGDSKATGYVRVTSDASPVPSWRISDLGWSAGVSQLPWSSLTGALQTLASGHAIERLGGWLPNEPAVTRVYDLAPRNDELTMFKRLDGQTLDPDLLDAAQHIREIDHV